MLYGNFSRSLFRTCFSSTFLRCLLEKTLFLRFSLSPRPLLILFGTKSMHNERAQSLKTYSLVFFFEKKKILREINFYNVFFACTYDRVLFVSFICISFAKHRRIINFTDEQVHILWLMRFTNVDRYFANSWNVFFFHHRVIESDYRILNTTKQQATKANINELKNFN